LIFQKKDGKFGLYAHCKECKKSTDAEYRKTSLTLAVRRKSYDKKYAENKKSNKLNSQAKWRNKNRIYQNKLISNWKKENKDKVCIYASKRKATKLQAIPPWFEKEKVALVYKKAQKYGFEVDHVIPLLGKNVCGLHCWSNLQLLDAKLNNIKGNRDYPDH
jgi:hypothetical protein